MPRGRPCPGKNGGVFCRRQIRGFLQPCLLLLLHLDPSHGYDLAAGLAEFGLGDVDPSLVYRMLRDLEDGGLVTSEWQPPAVSGPPRRVYQLTAEGDEYLTTWVADLRETDRFLHHFLAVYDEHVLGSIERQSVPQNAQAAGGVDADV